MVLFMLFYVLFITILCIKNDIVWKYWAVLVVALVYSFPDVFNVIMALISPYTKPAFYCPHPTD
jgi:hypothetical protein